MENKTRSPLVVLVLLSAVVFAGLLSYYLYSKTAKQESNTAQNKVQIEEQNTSETAEGPRQGDVEYQEPQTTIEIGTEGVDKGNFEKVENDNIFLRQDNALTQYPLAKDEIAVSCTTQNLAEATELDFNQVQEVKIATPRNLGDMLPENEFVVVFAQDMQGVNTVHTVALDAEKCAAQSTAE